MLKILENKVLEQVKYEKEFVSCWKKEIEVDHGKWKAKQQPTA